MRLGHAHELADVDRLRRAVEAQAAVPAAHAGDDPMLDEAAGDLDQMVLRNAVCLTDLLERHQLMRMSRQI